MNLAFFQYNNNYSKLLLLHMDKMKLTCMTAAGAVKATKMKV